MKRLVWIVTTLTVLLAISCMDAPRRAVIHSKDGILAYSKVGIVSFWHGDRHFIYELALTVYLYAEIGDSIFNNSLEGGSVSCPAAEQRIRRAGWIPTGEERSSK